MPNLRMVDFGDRNQSAILKATRLSKAISWLTRVTPNTGILQRLARIKTLNAISIDYQNWKNVHISLLNKIAENPNLMWIELHPSNSNLKQESDISSLNESFFSKIR